jgi:hypothetical protein
MVILPRRLLYGRKKLNSLPYISYCGKPATQNFSPITPDRNGKIPGEKG